MPFELTIHERDGPARKQVLARKVVFFGRREDNDIVFPFTFVSSRHGRLFLRDGFVFVEDMGSTNGTLVNGEPLTPMIARALRPEDRVQIEKIAIQARWAEDAASDDTESVTYHEMPLPAAVVRVRPAPAPPAASRAAPPAARDPGPAIIAPLPAPVPSTPPEPDPPPVAARDLPVPRPPDTPAPRSELPPARPGCRRNRGRVPSQTAAQVDSCRRI